MRVPTDERPAGKYRLDLPVVANQAHCARSAQLSSLHPHKAGLKELRTCFFAGAYAKSQASVRDVGNRCKCKRLQFHIEAVTSRATRQERDPVHVLQGNGCRPMGLHRLSVPVHVPVCFPKHSLADGPRRL